MGLFVINITNKKYNKQLKISALIHYYIKYYMYICSIRKR